MKFINGKPKVRFVKSDVVDADGILQESYVRKDSVIGLKITGYSQPADKTHKWIRFDLSCCTTYCSFTLGNFDTYDDVKKFAEEFIAELEREDE